MTDLSTIGTLAGGSCRDLITSAGFRRSRFAAGACPVLELFLLLSGLSSSLVLFQSFELLLNSKDLLVIRPNLRVSRLNIPNARKTVMVGITRRAGAVDAVER